MMRIRMVVDMPPGSARDGQPWPARGVPVELPTAQAAHLVASGVAEEAPEEAPESEPEPPAQGEESDGPSETRPSGKRPRRARPAKREGEG